MNLTNALILSRVIEFGSTEYAISTNQMRELNPFMASREQRITMNALLPLQVYSYKRLRRSKPKLANAIAIGLIVGNGYLTYRTFKIVRSK